jgi:hypothetical protein
MDVKFTLQPALNDLKKTIQAVDKQLLFAETQALNEVGRAIQTALTDEIKRVFDRPTPTTQKSVKFWPAGRKDANGNRKLEAIIFIRDEAPKGTPPARYLRPQVEGGERENKKFEIRLFSTGLFPRSGFLVPTLKTPLDKYGNLPSGQIVRMLSDLKAFNTDGFDANVTLRSKRRRGYGKRKDSDRYQFIGGTLRNRPGLGIGIWRRDNRTQELVPMLVWKSQQQGYKKIFKIHDIAQEVATEQFPLFFKDRLKYAIRTAR